MSDDVVKPQFSASIKSIRPKEPGALAWIALGGTAYLYKSQVNIAITLLFWRVEIYWVFKKFHAAPPTAARNVTFSHVNGVEVATMTREEMVMTIQSMALLLHQNGLNR